MLAPLVVVARKVSSPVARTMAYAAFALMAALVNLGVQWSCMTVAARLGIAAKLTLWPAIIAGTGAGLVVKYGLDKRYIFDDRSTGIRAHGRRFTLYSMMGVITTGVFWGTEFLFSRLSTQGWAMYLGGALGLATGYIIKYQLDRRYVFTSG